jgi:hypothetical protein
VGYFCSILCMQVVLDRDGEYLFLVIDILAKQIVDEERGCACHSQGEAGEAEIDRRSEQKQKAVV